MRSTIRNLALHVFLAVTSAASAQIKFEATHKDVSASAEAEKVTIKFPFKNIGDTPVRLTKLDSTCGCIKAETDRTVYAPGADGELEAHFTLGSLVGTHQKVVYVDTAKPHEKRHRLTITLTVPEVVTITPKVTKWVLGGEADERVVDIKMAGEKPMNVTLVQSTRDQVEFHPETIEPGRHYRVRIKPNNTGTAIMGALKIKTDSPIPKYQSQMAFFSISRSRPRPATATDPAKSGAAKPIATPTR